MWNGLLKKYEKPLAIFAGAIGLTAVLLNLDFNLLEANLYDMRVTRGILPKTDPSIVLITLDDTTTTSLDEMSPLSLDYHAKLLEALQKVHPAAVGYLVDLNQVVQLKPELNHSLWEKRFVEAAQNLKSQGTDVLLGTSYDVTGEVLPPFPLSTLPHALAILHKDGNVFSEDKITRRALTVMNGAPSFHLALARDLHLVGPEQLPHGDYLVPQIASQYFFFRYHGNPATSYERFSFSSVLKGEVPESALRGKILLVGTLSKDDSNDFAFTPFSKKPFQNPKLAIHANILDSIIHDNGVVRASPWVNGLVTFAVTLFVLSWVLTSTPLAGLFSTVALGLGTMVFGQLVFGFRDLWIRESQPLVGIFVGYYLVVPYRLIREYKKRWDYQRKNELLTQVEELKTKFLSLVTHDLKTPVARIQGLAEVLMRKASDRLIDRDVETLNHIIASTEELNRFISSILELSKAESNNLSLKVESKDVNQLIEKSILDFKAQARAKNIRIETALDPLFPIRLDSTLISKVLNNLIDNALKYSQPGSPIFVESHEVGEFVEITVRDQGIGMSPSEQERLFTRFYRIKNQSTSQIAGTGLGLYLSKFFVEAHCGQLLMTSELGKGTQFVIKLPMNFNESLSPLASQVGLRRRSSDQSLASKLLRAWQSPSEKSVNAANAVEKKENAHV